MEYFITGIDTDIGKTFITKGLACACERQNKRAGVFKPLQSGAIRTKNGLKAPDIEAVKELSSTVKTKCSYLFEGEVSPALAARMAGVSVDIEKIKSDFEIFKKENDFTFVEGAGGIMAPASDNMLCADIIKILNIPVIIVTIPFLGRLNHTLLTIHYAKANNLNIKGIIVNKTPLITEDTASNNFIEELKMYSNTDIIGIVHYNSLNIEAEFDNLYKKLEE